MALTERLQILVTADAKGAVRELRKIGAAAERDLGAADDRMKRLSSGLMSTGAAMSVGITAPLAALGASAVRSSMTFESAFAGVRKTVDATEAEFGRLREGIIAMSLEVPSTTAEIAEIAEAAGQLGIATPNIMEFTRTIIDLGNSSNLAGEEAASMMARFANVTQMPQDQFDNLASTVVALGNAGASTESEIMDMAQRLAAAGAMAGATQAEIVSVASALADVGIEAEAGGTAFSKVWADMTSAVTSGGEKLQNFGAVAGMSAEEFATAFRDSPAKALNAFIRGLDGVQKSGGDVYGVLEQLGLNGDRVSRSLLSSAGAGDILTDSLERGDAAWSENSAAAEEAAQRYATSESQMKIAQNRMAELQREIGDRLVPVFVSVLGVVSDVGEAFDDLPAPVQSAVVGLGGLAAVAGPAAIAVGAVIRGVQSTKDAFAGLGPRLQNAEGGFTRVGAAARGMGAALGAGLTLLALKQVAGAMNDASRDAIGLETAINRLKAAAPGADISGVIAEGAKATEGTLDEIYDGFDRIFSLGKQQPTVMFGDEAVEIDNLARYLENLKATDPEGLGRALAYLRENMRLDNQIGGEDDRAFADLQDDIAKYEAFLDSAGAANDATSEEMAGTSDEAITQQLALEDAAEASDALSSALARLSGRQTLASFAFDAASAAAEGYANAIERSTRTDEVATAAIGAGRALRGLRDGLKVEASEADKATRKNESLEKALDRLGDAASQADPKMSALGMRMDALAAGADAFGQSLEMGSAWDDLVSSAVDTGGAFRDFERVARRLPDEIDVVALSLGRYGKRQSEAIGATLEAGDSVRNYLESLIRTGAGMDRVRGEAARFRGEFERQLRQVGMNESQIAKYIEMLALTPESVETAIRLSGAEQSRFELNALLQLLEGRISEPVAVDVAAAIERGDIEGAVGRLQRYVASNPAKIDIDPEVDEKKVDEAKAKLAPLYDFDPATAAMGGYTEEQMAFVDAIAGFGDAATNYIAQLLTLEDGQSKAVDGARQMREALIKQLEGLGIPPETIDQYLILAGLTDTQVEFAIEMAGFDETVFRISTLTALLDDSLDPDKKRQIAIAIATGDYEKAQAIINGQLMEWERDETELPLGADVGAAEETALEFKRDAEGRLIHVPVGADIAQAEYAIGAFRWSQASMPIDIGVTFSKIAERDRALKDETLITGTPVNPYGGGRHGNNGDRAAGGRVDAWDIYGVNEPALGGEMFMPDQPGFVMKSSDTDALIDGVRALVKGGGGSAPVFHITETTSARETAIQVVRRMAARQTSRKSLVGTR